MVEPSKDPSCSEHGSGNLENNMLDCDKEPRQTVSGDSRSQQPDTRDPLHSKDSISTADATKVESGLKRPSPDYPVSPSCEQTPTTNAAVGRLVYVRRKVEVDTAKNNMCDSTRIATDSQATMQIKEPNMISSPTLASLPKASLSSPTSLTLSPGVSGAELIPQGSNHDRLDWEDRYHRLQMLLKKLNESEQKDYIQMLRSLSSVELSRHAVELEKRSIQLSLEEAKEMHRVAALNVLGRFVNKSKSPSTNKE